MGGMGTSSGTSSSESDMIGSTQGSGVARDLVFFRRAARLAVLLRPLLLRYVWGLDKGEWLGCSFVGSPGWARLLGYCTYVIFCCSTLTLTCTLSMSSNVLLVKSSNRVKEIR